MKNSRFAVIGDEHSQRSGLIADLKGLRAVL